MSGLSQSRNWRRLVISAGFLVTIVFASLYMIQPKYLSVFGLKAYDAMLACLTSEKSGNEPLIVDIDEASLAAYGQWPWPRYLVARLLNEIDQAGAAAIALDMIFAGPDRAVLSGVSSEMKRGPGVDFSIKKNLPAKFQDSDAVLAQSLGKGPFVLGYSFNYDENFYSDATPLHPLNVILRGTPELPLPLTHGPVPRGIIENLPALSQAAPASGFLNALSDCDGVLRRVPLIINFRERYYPSLALAALMKARSEDQALLNVYKGQIESLSLGRLTVPLDGNGNLLIFYHGKRNQYKYISASAVLTGQFARAKFKNKIVLVGATATGLHDFHVTPLDSYYPGVEVHATIIDNLLQGVFLSRPTWIRGAELALLLGVGFTTSLFLAWARPWMSALYFCGVGLGLWSGSFFLLRDQGLFLDPLYAMVVMVVNFIFLTLLKYWWEERSLIKRNHDLLMAQDTTILSLTALAETRDDETGGHILRTQNFVKVVAEYLASRPKYKDKLDKEGIDLLYRTAPLHDIGKVGVLDRILLKRGQLTSMEFAEIREHARIGRDILVKAEARLPEESGGRSFLSVARELAYTHHEKWDGSGYPRGLKGENIPLAGRLMALADIYDVLISRKRYKPAFSHAKARAVISNLRGTHLDPDIVDAFLALEKVFSEIVERFPDEAEPYGQPVI